MQVIVEVDEQAAARRAAVEIAARLTQRVHETGTASLALSGGGTPDLMFGELVTLGLAWSGIHVFQVDERVVADGDSERNASAIESRLIVPAQIPDDNWHPMPVNESDLAAAAASYAATLQSLVPNGIDVSHMGLGDDGHTASWPPGDDVVAKTAHVAVVGPFRGFVRMTLTPVSVNNSGCIVWLVPGVTKRKVVEQLLGRDDAIPATNARDLDSDVLITDTAPTSRSDPSH